MAPPPIDRAKRVPLLGRQRRRDRPERVRERGRDVSVGEVARDLPDAVAVARQPIVILRADPEAEDLDRLL